VPPARLSIQAGQSAVASVTFRLLPGHHTNSNTPSDEFLIPLRLTWESTPLEVVQVDYPKAHMEQYKFSDKPLSVYTGEFAVATKFKAPAAAPKGSRTLTGKLRYQACTDTMCFPPRTLSVQLPVDIR
jgi:hypothetical protein